MTHWSAHSAALPTGNGWKISLAQGGSTLAYADAVQCLRNDASFRDMLTTTVADTPFRACFWEVRPVASNTLDGPFEFVVVDSPALASVSADRQSFAQYFRRGQSVVTFENLGGDATLVAPAPASERSRYAHLLAFLRSAPESQVHEFWQAVGSAVANRLGAAPLWLSTSGLGVHWLHVRLDSRPKYYTYAPYRSFAT